MSTNENVPAVPEESQDHAGSAAGRENTGTAERSARRQQKPGIPDEATCLNAIAQLPGLIALKILSPSQGNSIKGQYETILRHHRQSSQSVTSSLSNANVLTILRESPQMLSLIEGLLTDEQLEMISQQLAEAGNEQA